MRHTSSTAHERSVSAGLRRRDGNDDGFAGKDLVVWIGKFKQNLVHTWFQSNHDNGIFAGVRPSAMPIIDCHVNVSESRRYVNGFLTKHRHYSHILGPLLDNHDPASQRF